MDGDGLLSYQEWVDFVRNDFENGGGCECDATEACDVDADGGQCGCDPQCFECPAEQPKQCPDGGGWYFCVGDEQPCPPVNCNDANAECPGESVCMTTNAHCAATCAEDSECADGSTAGRSRVFVYRTAIKRLNGTSVTQVRQMLVPMAKYALSSRSVWKPVRKMLIVRKDTDVIQTAAFADHWTTESVRRIVRYGVTTMTVLSSVSVTMSDAMAGLSVRLARLSVSILKATRSVTGVKNVHRRGRRSVLTQAQATSVTPMRPVSRCMETVCIHVIQTKVVHLVYVMSRLVTALIRVVRV